MALDFLLIFFLSVWLLVRVFACLRSLSCLICIFVCLMYQSLVVCCFLTFWVVYLFTFVLLISRLAISLSVSPFVHFSAYFFSLVVCLRSCLFTCQTVKSCLPHLSLSVCHLNSLSTIQLSLPVRWSFLVNTEWRRSQDIVLSRCLYSFVDTAVNVAPCLRL